MRTLDELSTDSERLIEQHAACGKELIALLGQLGATRLVPADTNLFGENKVLVGPQVIQLAEGMLSCQIDGRVQYVIEEGDLFFVPESSLSASADLSPSSLSLSSDFAVRVRSWSWEQWQQLLSSNTQFALLWQSYQQLEARLFLSIMAHHKKTEQNVTPNILQFAPGQKVIEEGTTGPYVYTLVSGHMNVFVDGVQVGEILPDEIFGALAALTDTPRTATVVASKESMVVALPKDHFIDLAQTRPTTVSTMVKDMARAIVDLNKKVIALEGKT